MEIYGFQQYFVIFFRLPEITKNRHNKSFSIFTSAGNLNIFFYPINSLKICQDPLIPATDPH